MKSSRTRWIRGVGAVVLVGALLGTSVVVAADDKGKDKNSHAQILAKLDEILRKLSRSGDGNHTLRWDTNNPSASRFTTAFTGAVLDKNTGLVWERAPDAEPRNWAGATDYCVNKAVGGTVGWRLPSVVELKSVQDPSLPASFVPASVFTGVKPPGYWSASTDADDPTFAWFVSFSDGGVLHFNKASGAGLAWCVRGGMHADAH